MKLRRIAVRHFRKLADPILIDGIGDGLTIIAGDNEEGKSTLLEAIKAAFFEPAGLSGRDRLSFNPLGRDGVPTLEIAFEQHNAAYCLTKVFRRLGTVLETPRGRLEGEAAEAKLRDLLRFERLARRSNKYENHGLQAVFWVDQTTSFDPEATSARLAVARDRFKHAIEGEVGGLAIGPRGRQVLERARARRQEFFGAKDKPVGDYAKALGLVDALDSEVKILADKLKVFDALRADLLARQAERQRFMARDPLPEARLKAEHAELRLAQSRTARQECQLAEHAFKAASAACHQAEAQAKNRDHLRAEIGRQMLLIETARAEQDAMQEDLRRVQREVAAAEHAAAEASQLLHAAETRQRLEEGNHRRQVLAAEAGRLRAVLEELAEASKRRRALVADLAAMTVDAKKLGDLRATDGLRRQTMAALEATATLVRFAPEKEGAIRIGGRAVDPDAALRLTEQTFLELEGFGGLTIMPGGEALATRRRQAADAALALESALSQLNVADLAAAERVAAERERALRELAAVDEGMTARLSTTGFTTEAMARAHLDEVEAELAALPQTMQSVVEASDLPDIDFCRQAVEASATHLRTVETALSERRIAAAKAEARLEATRHECLAVESRLAAEVAVLDDEALASALVQQRADMNKAAQHLEIAERRLMAADPDGAEEAAAMARRAVQDLEAEQRRLDRRVDELAYQLRGAGDAALGEAFAERTGRLELARAQAAAMTREAHAWRLLAAELETAARNVEERLVLPVTRRLQPYLSRLFAAADIVLDPETLAPLALRREGEEEDFASLSVGTREQIAILVRLALAQLLHDQDGEAPCLILDDALAYADEGRFEIMKALLQKAAHMQQIIILTCRPRDYVGLDARLVRLEECRTDES
ncbi:DNA repair exonuclease SbcCD ATPase subunit [Arboricoccus pini]|uniref:DNA repair exonuclease SbcCD ATPase subunit n=1 Tax=Arboricoccus pini TaxID=1963835 RepID=A0A212QUC3_9PROT|nr:AAA family ATPase [Arboricoccus pini]SNB63218.1 DNA repair exonuclease SbcCD ATPase subunit [Arboricoccus pini]